MEQLSLTNKYAIDSVTNAKHVRKLRQYLLDTKYTTYARLMSVYPVTFDADPAIAPAYTDGTAVHLQDGMSLAEQSLAIRHELLHILLVHRDDKIWRRGQNDPTLRNIAGDAELSNYYDDEDNLLFGYEGILDGGINVHVNNHEWKGKSAPDVYKDLAKKQKDDPDTQQAIEDFKDNNPFGDCIPTGTPKPMQQQAGIQAKDIKPDEAKALLGEILKQTTEVSHSPYLGPAIGDLGTVERKSKQAETKLYASLTHYFTHGQALAPKRTYASPHKQSSPGLLRRGRRQRPSDAKTLVIYIDRSGSMTDEKTGKADKIVENTTKRLRNVKVVKKYFASKVGDETHFDGRNLGGGTNYAAIKKDVQDNGYKTIAIITDNDSSNVQYGSYENNYKDKGGLIEVDMAWVCAVQCDATRVAEDIKSRKTICEVAL